jgi:predicted ATPase
MGVFEELLRAGAVVVATSNRSIAGLNSDGLQKELFGAFASTLRQRAEEVEVRSAADYRSGLTASSLTICSWCIQPGMRKRRVCTNTLADYEQEVKLS